VRALYLLRSEPAESGPGRKLCFCSRLTTDRNGETPAAFEAPPAPWRHRGRLATGDLRPTTQTTPRPGRASLSSLAQREREPARSKGTGCTGGDRPSGRDIKHLAAAPRTTGYDVRPKSVPGTTNKHTGGSRTSHLYLILSTASQVPTPTPTQDEHRRERAVHRRRLLATTRRRDTGGGRREGGGGGRRDPGLKMGR
jgi:hypothetical protein